ncbi:hypothetical protein D3C78_1617530 [compost metagenome]
MHQILLQRFEHKIERTQSENREHHRAVDNQRFTANGYNGRYGVERKHHVRQLNYRDAQ